MALRLPAMDSDWYDDIFDEGAPAPSVRGARPGARPGARDATRRPNATGARAATSATRASESPLGAGRDGGVPLTGDMALVASAAAHASDDMVQLLLDVMPDCKVDRFLAFMVTMLTFMDIVGVLFPYLFCTTSRPDILFDDEHFAPIYTDVLAWAICMLGLTLTHRNPLCFWKEFVSDILLFVVLQLVLSALDYVFELSCLRSESMRPKKPVQPSGNWIPWSFVGWCASCLWSIFSSVLWFGVTHGGTWSTALRALRVLASHMPRQAVPP